jgi:GT2 family glycosyltransferase
LIDIFITAYLRPHFTDKTIKYLVERTNYPYQLWMIDYGLNQDVWKKWKNHPDLLAKFNLVKFSENLGIHAAWNTALALSNNEYFITTDNDIYVPDLEPDPSDWLSQLVSFMDQRPDYGAISLHPHVFIGAAEIPRDTPEDVVERNMCGAVMRIMRTDAVRSVGGWERKFEIGRDHEESWICSRLQGAGFKTGITPRLRAYHEFGQNWGYPPEFTPEMQKHRPELTDYVTKFDRIDAYDQKTWYPK